MLDELDTHAAGQEGEDGFWIGVTDLADLDLVIGLAEFGVGLGRHLAFEETLEARHHIAAGGVIGRDQINVAHLLIVHELAHRLGRLVVLPGGREEIRRAFLARNLVRPGIGRDQHDARLDRRLINRQHDVRPDDTAQKIDLVARQHLVGDLAADIGLLLIVTIDDLRRDAAELTAEHRERKLACVLHVLADDAGRAAQGGNEADLDVISCAGRRGKQQQRGHSYQVFLHVSPVFA